MIDTELQSFLNDVKGTVDKDVPGLYTLGSQNNWSDIPSWVPSGCSLLDAAMTSYDKDGEISGQGYAAGRWYEIYGAESSGKTTSYIHAMVENQNRGGINALIDSETRLYKPRAARMGLDLDRLVMINAPYIEKGIEGIETLLDKLSDRKALAGRTVLFAWDTIAVSQTYDEYKGGLNSGGMAGKSRTIHEMIRELANKLPSQNACLLLINQIRDTMASYGKPTDTPGGRGIKFQASVRLEYSRSGVYNDPYNPEIMGGIIANVKITKSSLFRPYAIVPVALNFDTGFDEMLTLVNFMVANGVVVQKSGRYKCPEYQSETATGKYLRDFLDILKEDELFYDFLKGKIRPLAKNLWKKPPKES